MSAAAAHDGAWLDELSFRRVAVPEESPARLCTALVEDRDGFLWIGTQGGVVRYDGFEFRTFAPVPGDAASLSGSDVRALHAGRDGRMWIGTFSDGFSVFDPAREVFTRFRHDARRPDSLSHDRVEALAEDASGALWVATSPSE